MSLKILFIGDIFGSVGRRMVKEQLHGLREKFQPDLVIADVENTAGGLGVTPSMAEEVLAAGVDVLTAGNHVWQKREAEGYLEKEGRIIRPANYPEPCPGSGWGLCECETSEGPVKVGVAVLLGRVFMEPVDDPFRVADKVLEEMTAAGATATLFEIHAEATSEKTALGHYLTGRASAVLGTHTHVATADERLLTGANGQTTAYQTDVGFTGPVDSVIGVKKELILEKFLTGRPVKFEAAKGRGILCAALVTLDGKTGRAEAIERIMIEEPAEN